MSYYQHPHHRSYEHPAPGRGRGQEHHPRGRGGHANGGGPANKRTKFSFNRPDDIKVKANHFKINPLSSREINISQYSVAIVPARFELESRTMVEIPNRRPLLGSPPNKGDKEAKYGPASAADQNIETGPDEFSTSLTRRILNTLQMELEKEGISIVHDGTSIVFSSGTAWDHKTEKVNEPVVKSFDIKVKTDCEDKEPGTELIPRRSFKVKLRFDRLVPSDRVESLCQVLNTILKNSMLRNPSFSCFGRKTPKDFFLNGQNDLLSLLKSRSALKNFQDEVLVGLNTSAQTVGRGINVVANYLLGSTTNPKPVLSARNGFGSLENLKGISMKFSLDRVIPPADRETFLRALKGREFNVYCRYGAQYVQDLHKRGYTNVGLGTTPGVYRHKNRRIWSGTNNSFEDSIIWDPDSYEFDFKSKNGSPDEPETKITVAKYFSMVYKYQLKYPKMPLVAFKKGTYYPLEFLEVSRQLVSGGEDLKQASLKLCDLSAGVSRMEHTAKLVKTSNATTTMEAFNFQLMTEALETDAKILRSPELEFQTTTLDTGNGKWNLRDVQFSRPSFLYSFAVLDLTAGEASQVADSIVLLLRQCKGHGLFSQYDPELRHELLRQLVLECSAKRSFNSSPEIVRQGINEAIVKAKNRFYGPQKNTFKLAPGVDPHTKKLVDYLIYFDEEGNRIILDDNMYIRDREAVIQSFAKPMFESGNGEKHTLLEVIRYFKKSGGMCMSEFRLFYFVESGDYVSPEEIGYAVSVSHLQGPPPQALDDSTLDEIGSRLFQNPKEQEQLPILDCPSILFVLIGEKNTELYNLVKFMTGLLENVQSQILVYSTGKFRNPAPQYLSNVALKLNSKLATSIDDATSWLVSKDIENNRAKMWLKETRTFIMGYSISSMAGGTSSSAGRSPLSVISGAACLNDDGLRCCQEMRFQGKNATVYPGVMKSLTKDLVSRYMREQSDDLLPTRVIVYRNSGHEGMFTEILEQEAGAIREAFFEYSKECSSEFHCGACGDKTVKGCISCCPAITYIVAQTDHSTRIVPSNEGLYGKNVPNGSVVTSNDIIGTKKVDFFSGNLIDRDDQMAKEQSSDENNQDGWSFLLVANPGLKGTSKGVLYHCIVNENASYKPKSVYSSYLYPGLLHEITYQMSLQYGTATVAPRLPHVLLYPSRAANVAMGYSRYLTVGDFGMKYMDQGFDSTNRSYSGYRRTDSDTSSFFKENVRSHISA